MIKNWRLFLESRSFDSSYIIGIINQLRHIVEDLGFKVEYLVHDNDHTISIRVFYRIPENPSAAYVKEEGMFLTDDYTEFEERFFSEFSFPNKAAPRP